MRNRKGKTTTKHGKIAGLSDTLAALDEVPEIKSVVAGRIYGGDRRTGQQHSNKVAYLSVQYQTPTGIKCMARSQDGGRQEVYLVTDWPELVAVKIAAMNAGKKKGTT